MPVTDYFRKASNGTTRPVVTYLQSTKTNGSTTATINAATGWNTTTGVDVQIYSKDTTGAKVAGSETDWIGTLSGTTLSNLTLKAGTEPASGYPAGTQSVVICSPTASWADSLMDGILTHADQDGTLKADSVDVTAVIKDSVITPAKFTSELLNGWNTGIVPAPTSTVNNGNGSFTNTYASSIASSISVGMRRRFTRVTAANTYMGGAFNGSSHYFTKTTPTGTLGTVTDNFTIRATVMPTSYADGYLACRADSSGNNVLGVYMSSAGQVGVYITSGGAANSRYILSYQSVPLNKKTHITATWASGTVVIYFNGKSVPVSAAITSGTSPTTAGTGGDFSIGRKGAQSALYFPGYISNVAVFNAVLSAATIAKYDTYKLLGSETNCIGAWALDNSATDQFGANNLTATGGVGYTNISPFQTGGSGVPDGVNKYEYGLVMSVSSDGLTEVVQVPEGCALPDYVQIDDASKKISATAYSTQANPYGWVADKGRWEVETRGLISETVSILGVNQWYNSNHKLTVPIGKWKLSYQGQLQQASTVAGVRSGFFTLSSSPTNNSYKEPLTTRAYSGASSTTAITSSYCEDYINLAASTTYALYGAVDAATGAETWMVRGDQNPIKIIAIPSAL